MTGLLRQMPENKRTYHSQRAQPHHPIQIEQLTNKNQDRCTGSNKGPGRRTCNSKQFFGLTIQSACDKRRTPFERPTCHGMYKRSNLGSPLCRSDCSQSGWRLRTIGEWQTIVWRRGGNSPLEESPPHGFGPADSPFRKL